VLPLLATLVAGEDGGEIRTRIARSHLGDMRHLKPPSPVGRHVFVGGSTLVPALPRDHARKREVEAAGGPLAPHRKAVTAADEVQAYESVWAGADGRPVFTSRAGGHGRRRGLRGRD